jgi:hypothetical protein
MLRPNMLRPLVNTGKTVVKNVRNFSSAEQGSSTITVQKAVPTKDGGSVLEKTRIVRSWNRMGRGKKIFIGCYLGVAGGRFMMETYDDGKKELIKHRDLLNNPPKYSSGLLHQNEWEAVKYGCSNNMGDNFFESLVFPWTIASNLMPGVVLWFNPEVKKTDSDKIDKPVNESPPTDSTGSADSADNHDEND